MDYLHNVAELSVPLIQEIVWLSKLEYDILDCLKPPYYFIPKNSVSIETQSGHNLAQHAKLQNPKWIGVPFGTKRKTMQTLIQKALQTHRTIGISRHSTHFQYHLKNDIDAFIEQNYYTKWNVEQHCIFDDDNFRLVEFHVNRQEDDNSDSDDDDDDEVVPAYPLYLSGFEQLREINYSLDPYSYHYRFPISRLHIQGCPNILTIDVSHCQIKELDLSSCVLLESLFCQYNPLTKLNIEKCLKLEELNCSYTLLSELDLRSHKRKQCIRISKSTIQKLYLGPSPCLTDLVCSGTPIQELDIKYCFQLRELGIRRTKIKQIDIKSCQLLTKLYCNSTTKILNQHPFVRIV